jgi:hypothetical protein
VNQILKRFLTRSPTGRPLAMQTERITPKLPPADLQANTRIAFPNAGISFLHAIPAMGSKFGGPKTTGPQGQPVVAKGDYRGSISLYFGEIPK